MSRNRASMIFSFVSQVIEKLVVLCYASSLYWPPLMANDKATRSLPNLENDCQLNGNKIWPCMMVNQSWRWLLMSMYGVVTGFIG
jgi:hypothetical protein